MKYVESPCKNCKERFELCHSVCPKYLEFHAYRELIREDRMKAYRANPKWKNKKKK